MDVRSCLSIVLAAGEGTRMRSQTPKVLHQIAGRTLVGHVLNAVAAAGADRTAVVIGPDHDAVAAEVHRFAPGAAIFVQSERRGTAHAVLAAREALAVPVDDILIAFGDTPLIRPETLGRLRRALADGAAVAVLGFRAADPAGYGRLIVERDRLVAIREEKDASAAERKIDLCNAGLMALRGDVALALLDRVDDRNAKGEFYLTDVVAHAHAAGLRSMALEADEHEVLGVNTRAQLAEAEAAMQARLRNAAMDRGVTMIAPETVFMSVDTVLEQDVLIEPHVFFGHGVTVESGAVIHAFSHIEGARIGAGAQIGPFARLRPGTALAAGVKIGNFVETKAATIERGAKVNHLSYIGNSRVGEKANVGAGTITCNYDGFAKHQTDIGAGVFVGSNSALVAPVKIGDRAYIGSGSVITADVPADALAVGRGRQVVKEGWALRLREFKGVPVPAAKKNEDA